MSQEDIIKAFVALQISQQVIDDDRPSASEISQVL
jgi:hypothetical protein